jgi:hypothetical protein
METTTYERIPFEVEAVQVTSANIAEVAKWCDGEVLNAKPDRDLQSGRVPEKYVRVRVHRPMSDRQTMAFVTDWVLYAGKGYKVYTNAAFRNSFRPVQGEVDRVTNRDSITGQFVTDEQVEAHPDTTTTEHSG